MLPKTECFGLCSQTFSRLAGISHAGWGKLTAHLNALCEKWIKWSLVSEFDPYDIDRKEKATTAMALLRLAAPDLDIKDLYINWWVNEHSDKIRDDYVLSLEGNPGDPDSAWKEVERLNGNCMKPLFLMLVFVMAAS